MLNCYFCEHEAEVQIFTPMKRHDEYYVQCQNETCQARGPWRNSEKEAVAAWRIPELAGIGK